MTIREKTEEILEKLTGENSGYTIDKTKFKNTNVLQSGQEIIRIYYRADGIRPDIRKNSRQYAAYECLLKEGVAYQKDSADPESTQGWFSFFIKSNDVEYALKRLLFMGGKLNWGKAVFEEYCNRYSVILEKLWPTMGETGFAERNQSVNYVQAYENLAGTHGDGMISWFEFQIAGGCGRNDNHIDAALIDTSEKRIILIESKRYLHNGIGRKQAEVCKDIGRLLSCSVRGLFSDRLRGENLEEYKLYGCILADIWDYGGANRNVIHYLQSVNGMAIGMETLIVEISEAAGIKNFSSGLDKEGHAAVNFRKVYTTEDTDRDYWLLQVLFEIEA